MVESVGDHALDCGFLGNVYGDAVGFNPEGPDVFQRLSGFLDATSGHHYVSASSC